jgi:fucose 4-O-acetylase-like acetyltransferase
MGAQRIEWIDCARGLGIILVVMGHTMTMIGIIPIHYIIFSFHMPLFVFLTTMLMKEHPWKAVAASKARSLLVPYLTYLALVGLPILVWETVHAPMASAKFLMRLVLGGNFLYGVFAAYWYVPAIYVALVLYAMMQGALGERTRYFVAGIFVVAMVAQGISALNIGMPIPYALHTVPALIVFIWLGRMVPWSSRPRLLTVMALVIVTGAIALDMVTGRPHFDMDIKRGAWGAHYRLVGCICRKSVDIRSCQNFVSGRNLKCNFWICR